jgi:hypothetical protein
MPHAIKVNCGTEFLNQTLQTWCNENGVDIEVTVPYSPSQNGIAKCMNYTLVELACAMSLTGYGVADCLRVSRVIR